MSARLEAIWRKRAKRGPMDHCDSARLAAGRGLEGNADQGGRRQVTVIAAEAWGAAEEQLGAKVDPRARRANLLVAGIDLERSRGRLLAVGGCVLRIGGETRPCHQMDEARPGLRAALDPAWRGGVFGVVEVEGVIRVGDEVSWVEEA